MRASVALFAILLLTLVGCGDEGGASGDSLLVVDGWDGKMISTLCVSGEEDYGSGPQASAPVREGIASFFGDIIVDSECDATITVSLVGEAQSANYTNPDSPGSQMTLYTGAEVQGTISLTADGETPLSESISGRVLPPSSLNAGAGNPRTPLGAPFWGAAYDNVCLVLQHWLGADDPNLVRCPEPITVTFTTTAGHVQWPEALRTDFLDACLQSESMCLCLLYGAESVLTEAEWIAVRDLSDDLWPEDVRDRISAVWGDCYP